MSLADLLPILVGWAIAIASPGPATLAIVGTSMERGRWNGLAVAWGVVTGSAVWAVVAALGLAALMMTHDWILIAMRYAGALYLSWLAFKSARSAMRPGAATAKSLPDRFRRAYAKGALIHLTNPKAPLFWGALLAVVVPAGSAPWVVAQVCIACLTVSFAVFTCMALAFSSAPVAWAYLRIRRWLDGLFAVMFGFAAVKILTARLT